MLSSAQIVRFAEKRCNRTHIDALDRLDTSRVTFSAALHSLF